MHFPSLLTLVVSISTASAQIRGFNYGATSRTGAAMTQSDFESDFAAAKGLAGTSGAFSSARLYTMIQAGTTSDPTSAIPAAIKEQTKLLLGLWASSGQTTITNEIAALTAAIKTYGTDFTSLVNGISVGSEDLYRISPTGLSNDPTSVGAGPDLIVSYIKQVRSALSGTALSSAQIGHVDTWDAWQNATNAEVVAASDWIGMNTFPYFQTTENNAITNAKTLFDAALAITKTAAGSKKVVITETGWPVGGKTSALAVPNSDNAKTYYDEVGCGELFGVEDVYWYTLVDQNTDTSSQPQFGVLGTTLGTTPLFNLTCPTVTSSSSSSGASTATSGSTSGSSSAKTTASSTGTMTTVTSAAASTATGMSGTTSTTPSSAAAPSTTANAATSFGASGIAMGAVGLVAGVMAML